ncbi:hypothetical protein CSOJ01_10651 [Colletotrichum sojae]|uniref:Uncharacterized protein n=1 Tax=Colletotrichum sojae TaxID=2175907 RepID=A0A8H6J0C2_9PEZI|nr:hypothetical protein CSOJ01_10651 [Colletotrichum sojae]
MASMRPEPLDRVSFNCQATEATLLPYPTTGCLALPPRPVSLHRLAESMPPLRGPGVISPESRAWLELSLSAARSSQLGAQCPVRAQSMSRDPELFAPSLRSQVLCTLLWLDCPIVDGTLSDVNAIIVVRG